MWLEQWEEKKISPKNKKEVSDYPETLEEKFRFKEDSLSYSDREFDMIVGLLYTLKISVFTKWELMSIVKKKDDKSSVSEKVWRLSSDQWQAL